jgi:hypothetical protein
MGAQQWYQVTFPNENGKCGLHYTILLETDGNPVAMTVYTNCTSSTVTCGGAEASTNYTVWDWSNSDPGFATPQCTDTYPTTFYVEVVATGSAATCMGYTLTTYVE